VPNAQTKADSGQKKERKKPVRQAPAKKDYPNTLAWLDAMREYEKSKIEKEHAGKRVRLDKRIAKIEAQLQELGDKLVALQMERAALEPTGTEAEQPQG
jgi:uncharacterized protein YPO0396